MKRILILVEGFTEERFIKKLLLPHFGHECYLQPVVIKTRRDDTGRTHKGGYVTYAKFKREVQNLLRDSSAALVTTMVDYHALANDFPGIDEARQMPSVKRAVEYVEQQVASDINHPRFLPYLSAPQIEALLFSDVETLYNLLRASCPQLNEKILQRHAKVDPEEIDAQNPPSHILRNACTEFVKFEHTVMIAQATGLAKIRQRCAHFNKWLSRLEAICEDEETYGGDEAS